MDCEGRGFCRAHERAIQKKGIMIKNTPGNTKSDIGSGAEKEYTGYE